METKQHRAVPLEIKSINDVGEFSGYGSVFGNTDSYGDVVLPGAFAKCLADTPVKQIKMLWQHDPSQPIGVYSSIKEDMNGLYVQGQLCMDVPKAREAYALLKAGALSGLSIGYLINKGGSKFSPEEKVLYLSSLKLMEVSLVTFPANTLANVQDVKSIKTIRDYEGFLRDVGGYSQNEAKLLATSGFKALQRDVDIADAQLLEDDEQAALNKLSDSLSKSILLLLKRN